MPRHELECVGGPRCGDRLFPPPPGEGSLRVPADPTLTEAQVRLLVPLDLPSRYRVGIYQVRLHPSGDFVLVWDDEVSAPPPLPEV